MFKPNSLSAIKEDLYESSKYCQDEESQKDDTAHISMTARSVEVLLLHVLVRQLKIAKPVRHYGLVRNRISDKVKNVLM